MTDIKPLRGKVLVEIIPETKETQSGLVIVRKKEIPTRGRVLAVGLPIKTKRGEQDWQVEPNEIIHFKRQWTQPNSAKDFMILKTTDFIAIENAQGLKAVDDHIIVKRVYTGKAHETSSLILPEISSIQSNEEDFYGEVIAVGPKNPYELKVGDSVVYQRNEGLEINHNGQVYFDLKPRAVLAAFDKN